MILRRAVICLALVCQVCVLHAYGAAPDSLNRSRLRTVVIGETALYGITMVGLNQLWYADYPHSAFHFFNDNREWLQMDKCGHAMTAYYVGRLGMQVMRWTGASDKQVTWWGGSLGFVFQTTIETLDGFSSEWGASWGDLLANTTGTGLLIGQQLLWHEQRIVPKFSFHGTGFAKYRPEALGSNWQESLLKDYNGQTYWLSVNPHSFLLKTKDEQGGWPRWLNVAIGYGAEGMTGGHYNPLYVDANGNQVTFERYRQAYLSLDIDLTRIEVKSKALRFLFQTFGFLKVPAPALELNRKQGLVFHPLYF
ncbi:MAG: DUF2279 domain-containing protein [Flavobacteriales bacterium]|nr:DUF2279 domain-containing protein [Flavobacteriales bacterium]MCB9448196.1 DUF2279 domain-containing protein [Flavobacteriales bacterium]